MEAKQIESKLKSMRYTPSEEWKEKALEVVHNYADNNVTISETARTPNVMISKFNINTLFMQKKIFLLSLTAFLVVGLSFAGLVSASDSAVPGDTLYAFDRLGEAVRRRTIANPASKSTFEMDILEERMAELEIVLEEDSLTEDEVTDMVNNLNEQMNKVDYSFEFELNDSDLSADEVEELKARYRSQIDAFMLKLQGMEEGFTGQFQQGERNFEEIVNQFKNAAKNYGVDVKVKYKFESGRNDEDELEIEVEYEDEFGDDRNGGSDDSEQEQESEENKNYGDDQQAKEQEQNENGDDNGSEDGNESEDDEHESNDGPDAYLGRGGMHGGSNGNGGN